MRRPLITPSGDSAPKAPLILSIESLDHEARGIAHHDGKVIFVDGAVTGEVAEVSVYKRKGSYEQAQATHIRQPGFIRVSPRCRHFGVCGGCNMQHVEASAQVAVKQRILEDDLARIGRVKPRVVFPAIHGPTWGYRHRARLSVRVVDRKGGAIVGFRERRSSFVTDMNSCETLPPAISALLQPLRGLVDSLTIRDRLPQIEVAVGDAVTVLVLRILMPLDNAGDCDRVRAFADTHGVQIWLQAKGPETATPFYPLDAPPLAYSLPQFNIVMPYAPSDFTQVNPDVNQALVARAMQLLAPRPGEHVADLFCGLGNFTLAIARLGAHVVGVEGSASLVNRARANAILNGLDALTDFRVADLFAAAPHGLASLGPIQRLLIDPPRDGAMEVCKAVGQLASPPQRIVYVSCNPATLARDAQVLVHTQGYRLSGAGVINMFPHTAHVESIAVFSRHPDT